MQYTFYHIDEPKSSSDGVSLSASQLYGILTNEERHKKEVARVTQTRDAGRGYYCIMVMSHADRSHSGSLLLSKHSNQ